MNRANVIIAGKVVGTSEPEQIRTVGHYYQNFEPTFAFREILKSQIGSYPTALMTEDKLILYYTQHLPAGAVEATKEYLMQDLINALSKRNS